MGIIISKFRKEKSTTELLEGLEEKIQQLEKYTINTQERRERFVKNFMFISIGAYIVIFLLWYFFYLPPTWKERIVYFLPLSVSFLCINWLRKLFTWYFQRKLNKNSDKLSVLRKDKVKILEKVMEKETYKVAVNLLERFGGKPQSRATATLRAPLVNAPQVNAAPTPSAIAARTPNSPHVQLPNITPDGRPRRLAPYVSAYENRLTPSANTRTGQELRRRTPFPVIDISKRSPFERIIDALVGDAPHDRFAMICKTCNAHNGMAPKEEYDYVSYRCAFCDAMNPARKERPVAPRLSLDPPQNYGRVPSESSESSSIDEDEGNVSGNETVRSFLVEQRTDTTEDTVLDDDENVHTAGNEQNDRQLHESDIEPQTEQEQDAATSTVTSTSTEVEVK